MNVAQTIRNSLDMQEVARYYGYTTNRAGFAKCPFHTDKTASMKIYAGGKGWHCYGCHNGGSVIDFVMKLFGLSFQQALVRLDHDFRLNITNEKPDMRQIAKLKAEQKRKEKELQDYRALHNNKVNEFKRLFANFRDFAPKNITEEIHPKYVEACHRMPQLQWWLEENPYK